MKRQRLLQLSVTIGLLIVVTLALVGVVSHVPSKAKASGNTYTTIASSAISNMLSTFYNNNGAWYLCESGCGSTNTDWGADSLTYTLWLRWKLDNQDTTTLNDLKTIGKGAPGYGPPCQTNCSGELSDIPAWDSLAAVRDYEATGMTDSGLLSKAESAFNYIDGAAPSVFAFGDCPSIHFQWAGSSSNHLKTLETDSNYIKDALLLYQHVTDPAQKQAYLDKAKNEYAAVRKYFLDASLPLYSTFVFDYNNGSGCQQLPGRFFASVNGNMIYNGLTLAKDTGDNGYQTDALNTAQAVMSNLSDANGVYADLQAENDVAEPMIEAMYNVATGSYPISSQAQQWLLTAASASASSVKSDGTYSRFFDGPPTDAQSTAWQVNGGYSLAVVAAGLDPNGSPSTTSTWANATKVPSSINTSLLPYTINFTGTGIALLGQLGAQCCEPGHAGVLVDGKETTDKTGIWQGKDSSHQKISDTVLFAWRWPTKGSHTITINPGAYNPKEGGSFIQLTSIWTTDGGLTQGNTTTVDDSVMGSGQNQFTYSGSNWVHCASGCLAGSYNNTVSLDTVSGEYATISFTGTQIKFYTDARNNRGIAGVSLDGGSETNVDLYSANDAADLLVWTSPTLSSGTHTLKIRNTGNKDSQSSGTTLAIDRVDIINGGSGGGGTTTVDDSVMGGGQNQFSYSGSNWFHCTSGCMTGSYNNTVSLDTFAGEYATISFTGTQVKFYTDQRNNRGIAGISLDGGSETNVDLYAANDAADHLIWTSPTLSSGTHTLKIRNTGTKDSQSSGTTLAIDRVDILP